MAVYDLLNEDHQLRLQRHRSENSSQSVPVGHNSRVTVGVQRPYTSAMRDKALEYGLTSRDQVEKLQTWLYNNNQYTKPYSSLEAAADGIYGTNTNAAVENWLNDDNNKGKTFQDLMNLVNGVQPQSTTQYDPNNPFGIQPTYQYQSNPVTQSLDQIRQNFQSALNSFNSTGGPILGLDKNTMRGNFSKVSGYDTPTYTGAFNRDQAAAMRGQNANYIGRNGQTYNFGDMRRGQIRRLGRQERRADIRAANNIEQINLLNRAQEYDASNNPTATLSYQQGGKMNDEQLQQAFLQFLAEKSGAKNEKELQAYVQQLGEEGLQQAYAEFAQLMQQQTRKAKHGAKLNYIKQLKHQCPEGQELVYFKRGGMIDCGCMGKKMEDGGKTEKKQSAVEKFRAMKAKKGATAPKAKEAYSNGNYYEDSRSLSDRIHGRKSSTVTGPMNSQKSPRQITQTITRDNDTIYSETPAHDGTVRVKTRTASSSNKKGSEYDVLKRRYNEAKSVADKREKGGKARTDRAVKSNFVKKGSKLKMGC